MTRITDEELLELIKKKNSNAFETLFKRYELSIFNYVLKFTGNRNLSQELLQETFTKLWFAASQFDAQKGNVKNWLFTIALNLSRNEISKKYYAYNYEDLLDHQCLQGLKNENLPDKILEKKELESQIAKALAMLKPPWREVVIFKHFQHLKFREIAEITKLPESTIKSRLIKAMIALKEILKKTELNQ